MTAGTGVEHGEFNASTSAPVHFLQIWIIPEKAGLKPSYEQKTIEQTKNKFILIGSREGSDAAVTIHQDVNLYAAYLATGQSLEYTFKPGRVGWLQLIKGQINCNGFELTAGDGAAIQNESQIHLIAWKKQNYCCLI